jgi:hypothetical protein
MIYLFAFNFTRPQACNWSKTIKTFQLPWTYLKEMQICVLQQLVLVPFMQDWSLVRTG